MPTRRRTATGSTPWPYRSWPSKQDVALDAVAGMRSFIRFIVRSRVDLPQPDGPIRAVTSRALMSIETSLTARNVPYQQDVTRARARGRRSRSTAASGGAGAGRIAAADRDRRRRWLAGGASAMGACIWSGLLYHWMCRDRRARTMSARPLSRSMSPSITTIAAAAMPWKSSCGRLRPVEDLDRQDGELPGERVRQEGHER